MVDDHRPSSISIEGSNVGLTDANTKSSEGKRLGGWSPVLRILVMTTVDTTTFFAIGSNLVTYMINVMHLGLPQSAKSVNNWIGTIFITPLIGAFVADSYWSRYWTIASSYALYLIGLTMLTLSVSIRSLRPPACQVGAANCSDPSKGQLGLLFLSLYITALGSGCLKPCIISFGVDQFNDDSSASEVRARISFFNWIFWGIHMGGLLAVTLLVYVQDNVGWGWGFGILTILTGASVVLFFTGTRSYRYSKPGGSPITRLVQVGFAAASKWRDAADPGKLYEEQTEHMHHLQHTPQFLFLDKAAMKSEEDELLLKSGRQPSPWKLCPITQVEEAKLVLRMLLIWLGTLWFTTAPAQMPTLFVRQGSTMDNRLGSFKIPPASMLIFNNLAVILFIPIYDWALVPIMRRFSRNTRGISLLQRMGTGMFIGIVAMIIAARIEVRRLKLAKDLDFGAAAGPAFLPMSIFWLVPPYMVLGLAEAFTNTGLLEFFYNQAPDSMQSLGSAVSYASLGVGSFFSSILITIVNRVTTGQHHGKQRGGWIQNDLTKGHLDYFYWLLAVISTLNLGIYVLLARWYKYKQVEETTPQQQQIVAESGRLSWRSDCFLQEQI